jgi:hypothetical protein
MMDIELDCFAGGIDLRELIGKVEIDIRAGGGDGIEDIDLVVASCGEFTCFPVAIRTYEEEGEYCKKYQPEGDLLEEGAAVADQDMKQEEQDEDGRDVAADEGCQSKEDT